MRNSKPLPARRLRLLVVGTAAVATASIGGIGLAGGSAAATKISPTGITAFASTDNSSLAGAVPTVLAAVGTPVSLAVTLTPAGASFNTDTKLTLTASLASGGPSHGAASPTSVIIPAGVNSISVPVTYSAVDNGVQVTVAPAKTNGKLSGVAAGTTAPFDVLKVLHMFPASDPNLATGVGVGDADCTQASTESECGTIVLSHGIASSAGALSLGACTPDLGCTSGSQVVQFIAGITYTQDAPAVLVIRCDKKQCPGGGIKSYTVKLSFAASGPLSSVSAPCLSKGVALDAAGNTFCTDYVQSHRDNSGDTLLYVLFTDDMRAST